MSEKIDGIEVENGPVFVMGVGAFADGLCRLSGVIDASTLSVKDFADKCPRPARFHHKKRIQKKWLSRYGWRFRHE